MKKYNVTIELRKKNKEPFYHHIETFVANDNEKAMEKLKDNVSVFEGSLTHAGFLKYSLCIENEFGDAKEEVVVRKMVRVNDGYIEWD